MDRQMLSDHLDEMRGHILYVSLVYDTIVKRDIAS